ncbi:MAG: FliI/YscN family ATPase [Planctomycetales bacterium]|nr:FliI/YscN family ATPase [Planctomycetales bacterium]
MLKLNVNNLLRNLDSCPLHQTAGRLVSANGMLTVSMPASVHDTCHIVTAHQQPVLAKVIGFDAAGARVLPFSDAEGISPGSEVITRGRNMRIPCGSGLLGRVVNGLGEPIDDKGPLIGCRPHAVPTTVPAAMARTRITEPFLTGQRVIDGLLTIGCGQRMGLFAGSGVGKSTLLGEIAKSANSDINVIALIGERGLEVRPFIDDCLGAQGLARSVVVVSTSDELPLMRVQAALTATTIASYFRDRAKNVLYLIDSMTRLATAQREIGLHLGEPPTTRGYTPSVFRLLASVLEQLGNNDRGSITAILTVLVEGDEFEEPITDAIRSIADGHVVLSRQVADAGIFPAIDVLKSVSRAFRHVTTRSHQEAAIKIRSIISTYNESSDMIRIGAYQNGASPELDLAVRLLPYVQAFVRQDIDEASSFEQTLDAMQKIAAEWR